MYPQADAQLGAVIQGTGPQECREGWWVRDEAQVGVPGFIDPLQMTTAAGDVQFWPFGALATDPDLDLITLVALRQVVREDRYESNGIPVVRAGFFDDPTAAEFRHLVGQSGYVPVGGYWKLCGPIVEGPQGLPMLVVDSFEPVTPPTQLPPDPIELQGTLQRYVEPGTPNAWPMVEGHIITSSRDFPTDASYRWNQGINSGTIPFGSEVYLYGHPFPDASPAPKLVPIEFRVLRRGEGTPDPGDVDLPDEPPPPPPELAPPPEYDPDPWDDIPRPEIDPDPWDLDGDDGNGPDAGDPDDPNGWDLEPYPPPPPNGNGNGTGPSGPEPVTPTGTNLRDIGLAAFVLFFLPGFLSQDKDKSGEWDLAGVETGGAD